MKSAPLVCPPHPQLHSIVAPNGQESRGGRKRIHFPVEFTGANMTPLLQPERDVLRLHVAFLAGGRSIEGCASYQSEQAVGTSRRVGSPTDAADYPRRFYVHGASAEV